MMPQKAEQSFLVSSCCWSSQRERKELVPQNSKEKTDWVRDGMPCSQLLQRSLYCCHHAVAHSGGKQGKCTQKKKSNSPILSCTASPDYTAPLTVLYGHPMLGKVDINIWAEFYPTFQQLCSCKGANVALPWVGFCDFSPQLKDVVHALLAWLESWIELGPFLLALWKATWPSIGCRPIGGIGPIAYLK